MSTKCGHDAIFSHVRTIFEISLTVAQKKLFQDAMFSNTVYIKVTSEIGHVVLCIYDLVTGVLS